MAKPAKKKRIFDGRYEVLSIVGRGKCSVVYHARQLTKPEEEVALKVLVPKNGRSNTDRLRKEALSMVSCRHKYVIRLDDFHSVGALCYLAMEFAPNSDLKSYLQKMGGSIPLVQAQRFFLQITEGLAFVHQAGIIHRDIKPENLLVINERQVRLADFGVAVLPGETPSSEDLQRGVGTMDYMAPEVFEGKTCDPSADIYSLGLSFYELFSGQHPFRKAPLAKVLDIRRDQAFPNISELMPDLPQELAEVIMRALRFEAKERFKTAKDMLAALMGSPGVPSARTGEMKVALPPELEEKEEPQQEKTAVVEPPTPAAPTRKPVGASQPEEQAPWQRIESAPEKGPTISNKAHEREKPFEEKQPAAFEKKPPSQPKPAVDLEPEDLFEEIDRSESTQGISNEDIEKAKAFKPESEVAKPAPATLKETLDPFEPKTEQPFEPFQKRTVERREEKPANIHKEESAQQPFEPKESLLKPSKKSATTPPKSRLSTHGTHSDSSPHNEDFPFFSEKERVSPKKKSESAPTSKPERFKPSHMKAKSSRKEISLPQLGRIKWILIALLGLFILHRLLISFTGRGIVEWGNEVARETESSSSLFPHYAGGEITFPNLPSGTYQGVIENLIPGHRLPMVLVSYDKKEELAIIIGIEGWTPPILSLDPEQRAVRTGEDGEVHILVTANGLVLRFSADDFSGGVGGRVVNQVTEEEGRWFVRPMQ